MTARLLALFAARHAALPRIIAPVACGGAAPLANQAVRISFMGG
jgi:hypothetical protein